MYDYEKEKAWIFSDVGQREFLKARDWVHSALGVAGAFLMETFLTNCSAGSTSWHRASLIDRMIELGELREVSRENVPGQYRVFVKAR